MQHWNEAIRAQRHFQCPSPLVAWAHIRHPSAVSEHSESLFACLGRRQHTSTTPGAPIIAAHAQRARDDRADATAYSAAGSQARGTLKKEKKKEKPCTAGKKKRADLRARAMLGCGRGRTSPVGRATALQLQVFSSHSCTAVSPCWYVHSGADD